MNIHKLLNRMVRIFGSQTNIAKQLNIDPMAISQWKSRGYIPTNRALQIEKLTGGLVTALDVIRLYDVAKIKKSHKKMSKKTLPVRKNRKASEKEGLK